MFLAELLKLFRLFRAEWDRLDSSGIRVKVI